MDYVNAFFSKVPWKSNYSTKKDSTPKYESSYASASSGSVGRNRSDSTKKSTDEDKGSGSTTSRIANKYTGAYTAGYPRDSTAARDVGYSSGGVSRLKSNLEKKDTSYPPVTYRTLARTGARSRDPSPISQSEKSSSSSSYINRLCPKPYTRSVSRERTESTSSSSSVPKHSLRATSVGKDELTSKYGKSREDLSPKYTATTNKYGGRTSTTTTARDDNTKSSRFSSSRTTSREDLSSGSQKYITSRFLPKNSVEKSYTAYSRPSTTRANETIRKNRELLNVLHAQHEQERNSRPPSRCSSVAPEDLYKESSKCANIKNKEEQEEDVEFETVTVVTRGTSPSQTTQSTSFLRSRRVEVAKIIERQITRPKIRKNMVDKEIQSDRLDDSTKSSRFAGASRISATPWSSFLDMKFSSPTNKKETNQNRGSESPKSISRTSSTKSLTMKQSEKVQNKDMKSKSPSPTLSKTGGKASPPKTVQNVDKKQLPPQIPKNETSNKPHSAITQNKDFRKSVLNMNPDGKTKKIGRRSNSVSSADSDCGEAQLSEATDVSENLTSCKSYPNNNTVSKLPQRITDNNKNNNRNRRSPSSDASTSSSTTASGSEDDTKFKNESNLKKLKSAGSSRTSVAVSSADELSLEKSPKPPLSPRQKQTELKEVEAKSFLMRALAPVTNLFKHKYQEPSEEGNVDNSEDASLNDVPSISITNTETNNNNNSEQKIFKRVESGEKAWWLEDNNSQTHNSACNKNQIQKPVLRHVQSGEKPWWLEQNPEPPEGIKTWPKEDNLNNNQFEKPVIKHIQSGEIPWWLDQNSEPPEGVQTWPNYAVKDDSSTDEGIIIYKIAKNNSNNSSTNNSSKQSNQLKKPTIKHVQSGEAPWWLDESAEIPEGVQTWPNYVKEDGPTEDGRIGYKMRRNDSNDTSWWLNSNENTSSNSKNQQCIMDQEYLEKHKIRHIDSGERAWWLNSSENITEDINQESEIREENQPYAIRHQESGERAWWLANDENETKQSDDDFENQVPLGDRASPEGLEMPRANEGRFSPYDNSPRIHKPKRPNQLPLFISKHTNIDDILGGSCQMWSPLMDRIFTYQAHKEECTEVNPDQVRIHEGKSVQPPWKDNTSGYPKAFTSYGKVSSLMFNGLCIICILIASFMFIGSEK